MKKSILGKTFLIIIAAIVIAFGSASFHEAKAASNFTSSYPCSETGKYCVSSGTRKIDGIDVSRPCWEWAYTKQCNYPSKNDCGQHARCYSLGQRDCLLRDSMGNCVNYKKEFSCKRWTPTHIESETVRYGAKDIDGPAGLVCKGIPCLDGSCVDKSYDMDGDMVSSISTLGALSKGKNIDGVNFKIFEGAGHRCAEKATGYSSCCQVFPKGWGRSLGAKCTREEVILSQQRQKNLCVPAGTEDIEAGPLKVGEKHHFCCWSNLLEKTIQVQARSQLGIAFTNGSSPNCRGLTLEELKRVDFSKMDFSEVAADIFKKVKLPNIADVEGRIKDSIGTTDRFHDKTPAHSNSRAGGVNPKIVGE